MLGAVVLLGLAWLSGAQSGTVLAAQATPCAENTNDEIRALVDQYNAAFAAHDVDTLVQLVAPDVFRDDSRDSDESGTQQVEESFQQIFTAFPDLTAEIDQVLVDAPYAAVQYTSTGTQAVAFGDAPLSGETVTWDGIFLVKVECGKISDIVSVLDQLAQQNKGASTPATPVASEAMASPAGCEPLTDASAATLMDTWYHDVWTGNTAQLAEITTADIYHHWAMGPDSSGHAAQLERVESTLALLPGLTSEYDSLIVDGDLIAVHWTQSLGDDTWGGINIFRTECGQIAEVWSEMNIFDLPAMDATPEASPAA
jgi:steroid delta-isomerase-like uncharacterized protein